MEHSDNCCNYKIYKRNYSVNFIREIEMVGVN